jgi:nucleotide-binding universal stress UspA family protein
MAQPVERALHVLWATDGSDESRVALPLLRRLVLPATEKLSVLSVAPQSFISGARPDPMFLTRITPAAKRRALIEAEDVAQQAATDLDPPAGVEVGALSRWGNAIEEVLRASRSLRTDLVVIGAKGHSNIELILLGSVSQGVVQHSPKPVLILRPGPDDLDRVLIGYDGSPESKRAVQFLDHLGLHESVVLQLVYVVEPFAPPKGGSAKFRRHALDELKALDEQRQRDAEKALGVMTAQLQAHGRKVESHVLSGPAGHTLDEAAVKAGADLIVLGVRKPSPESRYLLGGTAEKLVRNSRSSVLVVK